MQSLDQANIEDLFPYTEYDARIVPFNRKGEGNSSGVISIRTKEAGKYTEQKSWFIATAGDLTQPSRSQTQTFFGDNKDLTQQNGFVWTATPDRARTRPSTRAMLSPSKMQQILKKGS